MTRLIHLNGPSGIGKSTLARRYAADHPGVLCCDIDLLRTMIGGWEAEFDRTGVLIRTAALAMITAYLEQGHDVVLPQLVSLADQAERFEAAAHAAGATYVERILLDDVEHLLARFEVRGETGDTLGTDPWPGHVRAIVAAQGAEATLRRQHAHLTELVAERPGAVVVPSVAGEVDGAYRLLLQSLGS